MITAASPGKIHLIGEHTVVHGYPAIIAAINLTISAKLSKSKLKEIFIEKKPADKKIIKLSELLEKSIKSKYKVTKFPAYKLEITSGIPIGKGLGSSAALSAIVAAALINYLKLKIDLKKLEEIAYLGEKFFHGNPSGGDLAAVINGGLVWFRKENELLKILKPIPFSPSKKIKAFMLIDSGTPKESTKQMVEKVQKLVNKSGEKVENIFKDQEYLARRMLIILKNGNEKELIQIIKKAHKNLVTIGVVSQRACDIIENIERIGGAAKISGAGGIKDGSGMLVCYHQNPQKVLKFASGYNLPAQKIKLNPKGLSINES